NALSYLSVATCFAGVIARVEAAEQRAETLKISLGATRMDITDSIESRRADRLKMAELRSRAHDIKANFWEIERHLAMRVASAIKTIAIYKTKTRVARDSRNQVERQEDNVTENASKKRKWEGDQSGSSSHK
ncbi:hypothetical protein Tco_1413504, partial [Tanacetum coccineum]